MDEFLLLLGGIGISIFLTWRMARDGFPFMAAVYVGCAGYLSFCLATL